MRTTTFHAFTLLAVLTVVSSSVSEADDAVPSPAARAAVKALNARRGLIRIDGDYQVISVTLPTNQQPTDAELALLKALPKLDSLTFSGTLSDAGLANLKQLKQLRTLRLISTTLSAPQLADLKQALPECRVSVLNRSAGRSTGGGGTSSSSRTRIRSSIVDFLRDSAVQGELKLNDEQRAKARELSRTLPGSSDVLRNLFDKMRQAKTAQERTDVRAEFSQALENVRQQHDEAVRGLLSPEQYTRIKQLMWHSRGVTAIGLPDVVETLKLTKEQSNQIRGMLNERTAALRARGRNAPVDAKLNAEWDAKILAVLTPEQREAWKTLLGPPPKQGDR